MAEASNPVTTEETFTCAVCGRTLPREELVQGRLIRAPITQLIQREHAGWTPDAYVCLDDLRRYGWEHVEDMLKRERGELSTLEKDVLESLRKHEVMAARISRGSREKRSTGEIVADAVASFGGSWRFIITFAVILVAWIVLNAVFLARPFDPYPYILLNLVLSTLAALQAPIIMMSQNRQEKKDRLRAEQDYRINLKAELEIRHLHHKIDHILNQQWQRLIDIQQLQIDLMDQLAKRRQ